MIQLQQIYEPEKLNPEFRSVYEEAFPEDERRCWTQFCQLFIIERFCIYEIYAHQKFLGFISIWNLNNFRYIEHFAIQETERGKGFGSEVMSQILAMTSKPVILEVEEKTSALSQKRISFYKHLGFTLSDFLYFQPPYSTGKNTVKMSLMSYPESIEAEEFKQIKDELYSLVYNYKE